MEIYTNHLKRTSQWSDFVDLIICATTLSLQCTPPHSLSQVISAVVSETLKEVKRLFNLDSKLISFKNSQLKPAHNITLALKLKVASIPLIIECQVHLINNSFLTIRQLQFIIYQLNYRWIIW